MGNHYLIEHPPEDGGPTWSVFHPEVVMTGLAGIQIHPLRLRILHAATGHVPYVKKIKFIRSVRSRVQKLRVFCTLFGAGRFPEHPVCSVMGEANAGAREPFVEFRVGAHFAVQDFDDTTLSWNLYMAAWRNDSAFQN